MKRRTIFRKGLDQYVSRLKAVIEKEKDRRQNFVNSQMQYLPSHYWPQLKEMPPHLSLDGHPKEYDFPDLKNCPDIKCDENLFDSLSSLTQENTEAGLDIKQLENLQEELDNQKCKVMAKDQSIAVLKNRAEGKDQDIAAHRQQIEKLNRTVRDLTQQQKLAITFNEEKLMKKAKQLETILREKKCKNCAICLEGMNLSQMDQIDLITDLNKQVMQRGNEAEGLQEQLNQANKLLADVCAHNYAILRSKTQDFLSSHDQLKQRFEKRLMQVEDNLALESARYNEIIKTRVKQLQDKIDEQRTRILVQQKDHDLLKLDLSKSKKETSEAQSHLKGLQLDLKIATKDLKLKEEKVADLKKEVSDLQKQKLDKIESIKKLQGMLQT